MMVPERPRGPSAPVTPLPILARVDERSGRRLARSTAIFSLATGISRVLGLVREIVASYYFGAAGKINAFTVAFQVPNLFRALVADFALSPAFVPVFTELLEKGEKRRAWRVASSLFWLVLLILGGLTALCILLAPWIIRPFGDPGGDFDLAVGLSRVLFPIVALLGRVRHRRRHPQQLRGIHGPRRDADLLERRDHPRTGHRRPAGGVGRYQALHLRLLDPDRDGDPGPVAAAVASRARRQAPRVDRLARSGRLAGPAVDGAGDDRPRSHQLQPRDRLDLRVASHRSGARSDCDRQGVPPLHAAAGSVLRRDRDRPVPVAREACGAARRGRFP